MENIWIITAKIHVSETSFKSWCSSSANFNNSNVELLNCDTQDEFVQSLVGGDLKSPYSSIAHFYATSLTDFILSTEDELMLLYYDKEDAALNITISINREQSLQAIIYHTAMILSIMPYKKDNLQDICLISNKNFENVKYAIEFDNSNIKILKVLFDNIVIPERFKKVYNSLYLPNAIESLLDRDIFEIYSDMITERLTENIKDIINFATPEKPAVITYDAMYKTDGTHVLTKQGSIVEGADPITFSSLGNGYGMDKSNVYYDTKQIHNADIASFFVLAWGYAKDKSIAYFNGEPIANVKSNFRTLRPAYGYATDNSIVFYKGKPLQCSDYMKFRAIGDSTYEDCEYIAVDDVFTYYKGEIIEQLDYDTLVSIGKNFFKDKSGVYFLNTKLENLFPDTAKVLNEYYITDGETVVYADKKHIIYLKDVKPISIKVFKQFAIDKEHVYFMGSKIEGLKGAATKIDKKNLTGYILDDKNVFYYTDKLDADPDKFVSLDFGFGTDGTRLFFKDKVIKEGSFTSKISLFDTVADSSQILDDNSIIELGSGFKKLDDSIFYLSTLLHADWETFKVFTVKDNANNDIYTYYATDKNSVYYKSDLMDDADPSSFQVLMHPAYDEAAAYTPEMAIDNQRIYYKGQKIKNLDSKDIKPFDIPRTWVVNNAIIYIGNVSYNVNINNFSHIEGPFYSDGNNVFYNGLKIDIIKPESLMILSENYIKDDDNMCYIEEFSDGLTVNVFSPHLNSFDFVGNDMSFSFDRYNIFYKGIIIEDIDMNTINFIGDSYLMDKSAIFCGATKLPDVDTGMFMLLGDGYGSDGRLTYYQSELIASDVMIHVLGNGYATDGIKFWLYGKLIENPYEHQYITDVLGQAFI